MSDSPFSPPFTAPSPITPVFPDFHVCTPLLGDELVYKDCARAGSYLPESTDVQQYFLNDMTQQFHLPMSKPYRDCLVSVEVAGPSSPPVSINVAPAQIKGMAGWVLQQCVNNDRGMAGFVTLGIANMLNYMTNPLSTLDSTFPPSTYFLTVTISHRFLRPPSPGDYDPSVPWVFADRLSKASQSTIGNQPLQQAFSTLSQNFYSIAMSMQGGGEKPWWSRSTLPKDEMTYTCDSKLGDPAPVDCSKLRYELGAGSDNLQIEPGVIQFLSSNTCNLAISATKAITVTWAQIQSALDTLTAFCVMHPLNPSQGGRAFFGSPPTQLFGRKTKRQEIEDTVSGLNALPNGVNLTLYKQYEPWQAVPVVEEKTCTWKAVQSEIDVKTCDSV